MCVRVCLVFMHSRACAVTNGFLKYECTIVLISVRSIVHRPLPFVFSRLAGLVRYPLDAVTVINKVKAAVTETCVGKNSKDLCFEPVKNELAAYNELGCPLGGSRAFTSVN